MWISVLPGDEVVALAAIHSGLSGAYAYPGTPSTKIREFHQVRRLPHAVLIESDRLAREAGSARATATVMVGAASRVLPLDASLLERYIAARFASKGPKVVDQNLRAFRTGREAAA